MLAAAGVLRGARRALRRPGRRARHRRRSRRRCATRPSSTGPIVVHVLTHKGRGYPPAEDDDEKHLHDAPVFDPARRPARRRCPPATRRRSPRRSSRRPSTTRELVAITAAMPGPTGLLPFQERFPDRFFDVGIAEQHAVTGAAGMAMGGLRPVVAIYSTFLNRAWDQVVYDVALHRLPVVFCLDRAGITGDDGPSHHGVYDLALLTKVPGMTVFAPSSAQELQVMLHDALELATARSPSATRRARPARSATTRSVTGFRARHGARRRRADVCLLAVGKLRRATPRRRPRCWRPKASTSRVWDSALVQAPRPGDDRRRRAATTSWSPSRTASARAASASLIADAIDVLPRRHHQRVEVLGVPVSSSPHGKPDRILASLGLDADGIAASIRKAPPFLIDLDAELALALELADLADAVTLPRFRSDDLEVRHKADASEVTEADRGPKPSCAPRLPRGPARPRGARRGGGARRGRGRRGVSMGASTRSTAPRTT